MDALTIEATTPTLLLVFPESWIEQRGQEWGPLSEAASQAGLSAVITHWDALAVEDGRVQARGARVRRPGADAIEATAEIGFWPTVILSTWGVDPGHQELFRRMIEETRAYYSESPTLGRLDDKSELERCLRAYEQRTGRRVGRPRTVLSEEISVDDCSPGSELVIVKPSRGGQSQGIEIIERATLRAFAQEVRENLRDPFVVQELVDDVFLYHGRRWDMRIHALATSLDPLRYRVYHEGVAKTTATPATPGSARLEEWLNAHSYLEGVQDSEDLPMTEMLDYVEHAHVALDGFWSRIDELVGDVYASLALYQDQWRDTYTDQERKTIDRAFHFPGLDLIVKRHGGTGYELQLLEINSHPGLGWKGPIGEALVPHYRAWFEDLRALSE